MNSSPDNARQPTSLEVKELPIQTYQNILNGFRLERERADKTEEEENINLAPICKHWRWAGETGCCAPHTLLIAVILLSKNLWNNLSRIFSFGARRELTVIVFIFLSIRATKVVYEYVNIFICLKQKRKE